jgi:hypothetical protein
MRKIFEIDVAVADIILVSADGDKPLSETLDDFNFLHDYLLRLEVLSCNKNDPAGQSAVDAIN